MTFPSNARLAPARLADAQGQVGAVPSMRRPVRGGARLRAAHEAAGPVSLPDDDAYVLHLLRRTTYGITPEMLEEVRRAGGPGTWLERQLDPASVPDEACEEYLQAFPLAFVPPPELYERLNVGGAGAMNQLAEATLVRACWSRRQLFEVMVEFWSNHLHITSPIGGVWATRGWYDSHVIRRHAFGRFEDMLVASGTSPAMLIYLDNVSSKGEKPNENYGRELLELHTVGRDAGYSQAEVVDCARAFTGLNQWTPHVGGTTGRGGSAGSLRFVEADRYVGPLKVLGWEHPNSDASRGVETAQSLLRYLAHHPSTALRLAHKLATRFVSDTPPSALVERLAAVYLQHGTAVRPVLRALFASDDFAVAAGAKHRRPYEDLVSSLRALGVAPSEEGLRTAAKTYISKVANMGHAPFRWSLPDGYPDVAAAWVGSGSRLSSWNMHVALAAGWWSDGVDLPASLVEHLLPHGAPASRRQLIDALLARLVPGISVSEGHCRAYVDFLGGPGPVQEKDLRHIFPVLVAMILNSPAWAVR